MSENSEIDIDYVAKLARLDLDAAERSALKNELGGILDHFEIEYGGCDGCGANGPTRTRCSMSGGRAIKPRPL